MSLNEETTNRLEDIQSFYDNDYYLSIKPSATHPNRHYRLLANKVGIQPKTKVLDIACGVGEWLSACLEQKAEIFGVDLSKKAIEVCKTIFETGEFYVSPAETLPFEDNKFDVVTCLGSLEHFIDQSKALKEMIRVAKKDAIFVILVPNKDFLTRKLGLFSGTNQVNAKEDVKTLDEWIKLFTESGLVVKKRWKDLHILSWRWISSGKWYLIPLRSLQAFLLIIWPLNWQYQVYHLCKKNEAF